jgi:chemotaxis protein CheD
LGARRGELQVKLFGGGDVLVTGEFAAPTVGSQNKLAALRTLEEENLTLTASDLGGDHGRVIYFNTGTGEVLLRRLQPSELTVDV